MKHSEGLPTSGARSLRRVLGEGRAQDAGGFKFWFADQRWEWSDEVARIHGYEPGTVSPTTALLLSHKHPDDRDHVATMIEKSVTEGEPFCSTHRILDTGGAVHDVIVVADQMLDDTGVLVGTTGYYIDVTDTLERRRKQTLDDELPSLYAARAVIEQAKGAVMLVYGVNAEQAFDVLTWRSQETNTKLRVLAQRLITELGSLTDVSGVLRTRFDHLLLTVHERAGQHDQGAD
ncbi:PAS and ANTAR domain-containing protein [Nocardia caishijiensis]|uniref:histidine kinase n=1 Tax=Nocardia caishijiensis TaxID=184756 RepID=A0ABQ6YM89_9NOCA|nr:PAS and ANTAR domain-containing protein [Nocardia caishijiensis]KAF0846897.1 PAS domain S-box-containing protein [Nocardia caishijiensis]